jgi:hypothetical protein
VNDTKSETSTANATVTPNWKKILPIMPAHEGDGDEHRDDRERGGEHGEADLVGAFLRRAVVILPHRDVPHDVLAHDDRVIDQQADRRATGRAASWCSA